MLVKSHISNVLYNIPRPYFKCPDSCQNDNLIRFRKGKKIFSKWDLNDYCVKKQVKTLIVIILYINGACVLCAVIKIEIFCVDLKLNGVLGARGSILKLECEKLAQEKTEMQRHYVMADMRSIMRS
uniref:CSON007623 protein n=1 Tax=Culicoides sonorensis TaxID=179676 RepID=A0A336N0K4_CULSO